MGPVRDDVGDLKLPKQAEARTRPAGTCQSEENHLDQIRPAEQKLTQGEADRTQKSRRPQEHLQKQTTTVYRGTTTLKLQPDGY